MFDTTAYLLDLENTVKRIFSVFLLISFEFDLNAFFIIIVSSEGRYSLCKNFALSARASRVLKTCSCILQPVQPFDANVSRVCFQFNGGLFSSESSELRRCSTALRFQLERHILSKRGFASVYGAYGSSKHKILRLCAHFPPSSHHFIGNIEHFDLLKYSTLRFFWSATVTRMQYFAHDIISSSI